MESSKGQGFSGADVDWLTVSQESPLYTTLFKAPSLALSDCRLVA